MMVVVSLLTVTRLARPRSSSRTFSSLMPDLFHDGFTAGEDRNILQHGFATVTEAWRFDGADVEACREVC